MHRIYQKLRIKRTLSPMVWRFVSEIHLQTLHNLTDEEDSMNKIEKCRPDGKRQPASSSNIKVTALANLSSGTGGGNAGGDGRLIDFNADGFGLDNVTLLEGMRLLALVYHLEPHLASRHHSMHSLEVCCRG
jgi:hypothetical protein